MPLTMDDLFGQLEQTSQPRPDLNQQRPTSTFAGRVVHPGMTLDQVMARPATDSPDAEGFTGLGLVGGAGVIRGINTPETKQIVKGMWRRSPEVVKQLEASPKEFRPYAYVPEPAESGHTSIAPPESNLPTAIGVNPQVLKGRIPSDIPADKRGMYINRPAYPFAKQAAYGDLPGTAVHEGQHALTTPEALQQTYPDPKFARQLAYQIREKLPKEFQEPVRRELTKGMDREVSAYKGLSEAFSYLREASTQAGASTELKDIAKQLLPFFR